MGPLKRGTCLGHLCTSSSERYACLPHRVGFQNYCTHACTNEWISELMSTWGETSTRVTNTNAYRDRLLTKKMQQIEGLEESRPAKGVNHVGWGPAIWWAASYQSFKRCLNTGILLWNSVLKYSLLVFNILSLFSWSCQREGNTLPSHSLQSSCGWTKNKTDTRDFPDAPVVRIPYSQCRGHRFKPRSGN